MGITKVGRPNCAKGHYCPSYDFFVTEANGGDVDYRQIPCLAGTYNDAEAGTTINDCKSCPAKKACEMKGIEDATTLPDCEAGYFCKGGAESRYPDGVGTTLSGPCPAGHYCEKATEDPVACLAGTFNPQERATDISFCLPCPPGWLCTTAGLTTPNEKVPAGKFGENGLATTGCGTTGSTGVYCPVASQFELICPMGFYQPNKNRGNCFECPQGGFCMDGLRVECNKGYYCP